MINSILCFEQTNQNIANYKFFKIYILRDNSTTFYYYFLSTLREYQINIIEIVRNYVDCTSSETVCNRYQIIIFQMITSKNKKSMRGRHRNHVSFKQKTQINELSEQRIEINNKQKLSIQQLLNQSSIQRIQGSDLGKHGSRKDLISRSPQHWMGDASKQNIKMLIESDPKQIDLFDQSINQPLPANIQDDYITNENQDYNYKLLQMEYEKLIRPQLLNSSSDEKDDEELIVKMLNISQIQEKKREEDLYNSRRESMIEEKIQDFVKVVSRIINLKSENKILNNSINVSRNSEYKQIITKNLFQINQEWDNFDGTSKPQKIDEQESGFSLRQAYNDGQLQQDLFKTTNKTQIQTQKKVDSINIIKKFWLLYKKKKEKKVNIEFKSIIIEEIKASESFNAHESIFKRDQPEQKQQDFNNILNQLNQSSNHIVGDKSQQLSLEQKELNLMISNKELKKVNSNSFCEQKIKKTQGDSIVIDHLGSISAIRSTSKFRHASQHDESGIKEEDDRSQYYSQIDNIIAQRELWIIQKSKQIQDQTWKLKQLDLISKFKQMLKQPQQKCISAVKQVSTNTSVLGLNIFERSFDLKQIKNKEPTRVSRHPIQRKTKQTYNHMNLIRQKQKDITYIQDKKLSIILSQEQLRRLMNRQTISNDVDMFNGEDDISVQTQQILTQLNFSQNQIASVKTRRVRYNIQLQQKSLNDSITKLL